MQTSERTPDVDEWEPVGSIIWTVGGLGALETDKDAVRECLTNTAVKFMKILHHKMI